LLFLFQFFTQIKKIAPVKPNGFKKGKYIHSVPPGNRIDFIDFFLFELFEQLDNQGLAEKDKTPKLISAN